MAPFAAVVEATVQRSRPVILTAFAAMLAFLPLTQSVFWGTLACIHRDRPNVMIDSARQLAGCGSIDLGQTMLNTP